jgi:hypothetical protein
MGEEAKKAPSPFFNRPGSEPMMPKRCMLSTLFLLASAASFGQTVTATVPGAPWTTLDATDLNPNVPGADFAQIILPVTVNTYSVTVTDTGTWTLRVRYRDVYPTGITRIEICRTDDGTSGAAGSYVNASPAIGSWITLTTRSTYYDLCTGFRNRNNIHLNLRVTVTALGLVPGVSRQINRLQFRVY